MKLRYLQGQTPSGGAKAELFLSLSASASGGSSHSLWLHHSNLFLQLLKTLFSVPVSSPLLSEEHFSLDLGSN